MGHPERTGMRDVRAGLLLLFVWASAFGGCGSTDPGPAPDIRPVFIPAGETGGADSPPRPAAPHSEARPDSAAEVVPTTKIDVPIPGEDLHLVIEGVEFASVDSADPARAVRCTVRLCREDGSDAGPASKAPRGGGSDSGREGWTATFLQGKASHLLFRREADGMFWSLLLTADVKGADQVEWTVTEASLICIR